MQEDIGRAISRRDEAKSLFRVEPLDAAPQLACGTALILIGHVQLSVEDPTRALQHPGPPQTIGPLAVTPQLAWGRFATKSKPDRGAKRELKDLFKV